MAKKNAKRHGMVSVSSRQTSAGALSSRAVSELQDAYDQGIVSGATLDEIDPQNQVGDEDEEDE
jgi:hypothetical protein